MTTGRRTFLVGISTCAAVIGFLLWEGWCFRSFAQRENLGSRPPGEVFGQVFAIAPPSAVEDIKVAGYANLGGGDAWMRLHVNDVDGTLGALKLQRGGLLGPDKDLEESVRPPKPANPEYSRAVGWDDVKHVKRPEYYAFPNHYDGTGWRGNIIVDRERKLLFVEAQQF